MRIITVACSRLQNAAIELSITRRAACCDSINNFSYFVPTWGFGAQQLPPRATKELSRARESFCVRSVFVLFGRPLDTEPKQKPKAHDEARSSCAPPRSCLKMLLSVADAKVPRINHSENR
jgi:hypothetical protein